MQGVMPTPATLADIRAAVARDRHIQDHQFPHRRRDAPPPPHRPSVRPSRARPDRTLDSPRTSCTSRQTSLPTVFLSYPSAGREESPRPRRSGAITRNSAGQPRNDVPPLVPALRPAMQQHHRKALARRHVMQPHVAQIGMMMLHRHRPASLSRCPATPLPCRANTTGGNSMHWTDRRERYRAVIGRQRLHPSRLRLRRHLRPHRRGTRLRGRHVRRLHRLVHRARRARPDRADADRVRRPGLPHQPRRQAAADGRRRPRLRQRAERHAHGAGTGDRRRRRR